MTYHSWQWDIAIFHHSGRDNQHLLSNVFWSLQGFPGDLARSLGEDATLANILQTLDEHYAIVMTFDTLSKELYSLKQGSGENVAKFGLCLLQQVQILQSEYPGRIQQEHVEEIKWDCFYEGLSPEYRCMLAHKVDAKHPASYSNLLLAVWKLEWQPETRDPLLLKTTMIGGLNVTQPQASGNLFPSRKLKGNCTFMAPSTIVESIGTEGDSTAGKGGEEEVESTGGELETPGEIGGTEQPLSYIIWFANAVKLYQKKNQNWLGAAVLTIWWKIVQRISARSPEKWVKNQQSLNWHPWLRLSEPKDVPKSSLLEPQPTQSVEQTWEHSWGLDWCWGQLGSFDSGSTINAVTPEFVDIHSLDIGSLSDLSDGTLGINGFGVVFSWPLGYVVIKVQVKGVQGYDKNQVVLVIPDSIGFGSWVHPPSIRSSTWSRKVKLMSCQFPWMDQG